MGSAPLVIVDYNRQWPMLYEREKAAILGVIGPWVAAIEHIGSTSVPGLGAKPIIDIMIGLRRLDDAVECISRLEALGYQYVPEFEATLPQRRFFRKGPDEARSHHIHMVQVPSAFWADHIVFRDYLRARPSVGKAYVDMKKRLATRYGSNRQAYSDSKTEFIEAVLACARAEAEERAA